MIAEKQKIIKSFQINNLLFFVVALLPFLITSSFSFASSNKPLLFLGDKDYPPYEWLEGGTPKGLNVDICRELSRVIGREIKVELMQWKTSQEKVLKGEADGLIELDISEERQKHYDLTETTIEFSYSLFVRSDNIEISEVSDVEGKKVGVTAGGYPRRVLEKKPKIDLIFVKNYLEGFEYLKSGKIDALGADLWVAPYLIQKHGIKGITVTGDPFFTIKGAFAVKKGNTKLLNEIDAGIKKLIKDGTLDRLKKKWSRKEIIFFTQEKLQRIYIIVTILFLGILLGLLLLWIFTLKKQIRKRGKAEAELQKAHNNLEHRVKERTFDLEKVNKELQSEIAERKRAEEDLQERTRELQEANTELESFTYSVSHDLRAPLRAMQGFSQALLEDYGDRLDAEGKEYAQRIDASSQRMETLIQDLLAYSRLGSTEIKLKSVNLGSIVESVLTQLEAEIKEKDAHISVDKPLPEVIGHSVTLEQVVGNLITNAIRFVPSEVKPDINIRAEERDEMVRLWVEDNGIGISPEHHERIFNIFERLHGIESYPGTGIGLAIVKKGAEKLGGKVGVKSAPGKGSRFWIELTKKGSTK